VIDTNSSPARPQTLVARTLHEWKTLAVLGTPILIAQLAQMSNGVIDTVMAGHATAVDLAGVAIGLSIWAPLLMFFTGTLSALQPMISGHRGAGEVDRLMPTTWQGLYITAIASAMMILLLVSVAPLLRLLQLDAQTTRITTGYLDAFAWGVPALLSLNALRGLTDGLGHTRVIMVFSLVSTLLNLPLNYFFIYGFQLGDWGFAPMGGIGCGWATSASNWLALLALLAYLNFSKTYDHFHLINDWVPPQRHPIARILKLGLPIGFTLFVEVSMFCMIALFIAPLGPTIVAGHQIVLNITSVLFMVPLSLGMALTLRISYLVGAKDYDEARLLARSSLFLAFGVSCINAPILFFSRHWLPSLYTHDAAALAVAARLMALAAIFQIADVIQVTMINVLRGYKDTKLPMLIMLLSFWGICLPLGYLLTFTSYLTQPLGAAGFWAALIAGLTSAACLLTLRVFRFRIATPEQTSQGK